MTTGKALEIARTYVKAIADKDVDTILSISSDDVVCTSPIGQTTGTERFRAFHEGFARMIRCDLRRNPVCCLHGNGSGSLNGVP